MTEFAIVKQNMEYWNRFLMYPTTLELQIKLEQKYDRT